MATKQPTSYTVLISFIHTIQKHLAKFGSHILQNCVKDCQGTTNGQGPSCSPETSAAKVHGDVSFLISGAT